MYVAMYICTPQNTTQTADAQPFTYAQATSILGFPFALPIGTLLPFGSALGEAVRQHAAYAQVFSWGTDPLFLNFGTALRLTAQPIMPSNHVGSNNHEQQNTFCSGPGEPWT